MGEAVMTSNSSDLYNSPLALRYLQLIFNTNGAKVSRQVTLNMTNVGYWSNEDVTVQVLRRDESQLLIALCENEKFYAMLLGYDDENVKGLQVGRDINKSLIAVKGLTILKSVKIDNDCEEIPQNLLENTNENDQSSAIAQKINLSLVAILLVFKSLMSLL